MNDLPESVLQFGAGNFLRAFADLFLQQANDSGQKIGRAVIVQSTPGDRARRLNEQGGRYHVVVRGLADGREVDRVENVESVSRALVAAEEWDEVLRVARSEHLRYVISNTTEAGYDLHDGDRSDSRPPGSFPAKLLCVLRARYEAGAPGLTIVPCELRDHNADLLRGIVVGLAKTWGSPQPLIDWISRDCVWLNTLVDRIVTGRPREHPLLETDRLLVAAEPFAFWAVESRGGTPFFENPAIHRVDEVQPYALRKVRILNGAHTALVARTRNSSLSTVREAVLHPEIRPWLEELLFQEILPAVDERIEDGERFARQVLERFANPFVEHKLSDIALYHDKKVKMRLVPTREEYEAKFGRPPKLLSELLET